METVKGAGFAIVRTAGEIQSKQGLPYFVGISGQNTGSRGISMNLVVFPPGASAEPHCHGNYETALYLMKGKVLCRYGHGLLESDVMQEGDFLWIGPGIWHQPVNLSDTEEAVAIVARNDPEEQEHVELYDR